MSLTSGKRITRYKWTVLPTPMDVIKRVNNIAKLQEALLKVVTKYHNRGFHVQHIHCDGQFECLVELFDPIHFHIASPSQHVPEIERAIRTLKDDVRTTFHGLPFQRFTRLMTKACAKRHVELRNAFPMVSLVPSVVTHCYPVLLQPIFVISSWLSVPTYRPMNTPKYLTPPPNVPPVP